MRRLLLLALVLAPALLADDPLLIFEKLEKPLELPRGLIQTLPVSKKASYFGDSLRAVDCTDDRDLPFGVCGDQLFGGLALTTSHLSGSITIKFYPVVRNISHFEVYHGLLRGDDTNLVAPQGFEMPVLFNQVTDAPPLVSEGDLDVTTGGVHNIQYRVNFLNSALVALGNVNPKLRSPVIQFPGVRGQAWARFTQRPDGMLDFQFKGRTFLPLGKDIEGDPVRFPLPFCGPIFQCASVVTRGLSLHPHLSISTMEPSGPDCGMNCPNIPFNTVQEFTVNTANSAFGDDFFIDIPQLGGPGPGRAHFQGRLAIQFGAESGGTVPFVITSLVPEGLLATPPESRILGHGPAPGLLGHEELLQFPLQTYFFRKVAFVDEPYSFNHGVVDLRTGRVIGDMVYPAFYGQILADNLFEQNDGRIEKEPFDLVALNTDEGHSTYALFERGPNASTIFRINALHTRSFATYRFPSPDFIKANSWIAGPNARLDLFLRIQAARIADRPVAVKSGGQTNVLSSLGDRFSYSFTIPCDPVGRTGSFTYTNNNTGPVGGTFTMKRLASVSCINSRNATSGPGDYDVITFSGFGTWSKDSSDADPRLATVQISLNAVTPYVGIIVYQDPDEVDDVVLSSANTKPPAKPIP